MSNKKIGLVCWWSNNYGNAITNYALATFLKKQGYSVLMVDNMKHESLVPCINKFNKENYNLSSSKYKIDDLEVLNSECDCFVVGSDQLWNYQYSAEYGYGTSYRLDFVKNDKKKIAYASSFGTSNDSSPNAILLSQCFLLKRFDGIGVRERSGVDILYTRYGINSELVVDPVFLCNQNDYKELISKSKVDTNKKYLLLYILDPTDAKMNYAKKIARENDLEIYTIADMNPMVNGCESNKSLYINLLEELEVQDWLCYLFNADMILTDSFHGTCFCIIFHKKFISIVNRQSERFEIFNRSDELRKCIIEENDICSYNIDDYSPVEYGLVDSYFAGIIDDSKQWLINVIEEEKIVLDYVELSDDFRLLKTADCWRQELEQKLLPIQEKSDFFENQYEALKKKYDTEISALIEANKWLTELKCNHEKYIDELLEGNRWLNTLKEEHEKRIKELENGNK